jgi:hypothetical protein
MFAPPVGTNKKIAKSRPALFGKPNPKGCGTQNLLTALRVFHPPGRVFREYL